MMRNNLPVDLSQGGRVQVRRRQIWHKPRPAAGLGKRTGGAVLEGAMSVDRLGWLPTAHRRGHAERASRGEVNLGRRHGRGRAERAGREEADLGRRAGETRGVAPGRALDGRETRGSQPPGDVPGRPVAALGPRPDGRRRA